MGPGVAGGGGSAVDPAGCVAHAAKSVLETRTNSEGRIAAEQYRGTPPQQASIPLVRGARFERTWANSEGAFGMVGTRVLLIEDNDLLVRSWTRVLRRSGFVVESVDSLSTAHARLDGWHADPCQLVLLDISLPDGNGTSILPRLRAAVPRPAVAVVTGHVAPELPEHLRACCTLIAEKPTDTSELIALLNQLAAADDPRPDDSSEARLSEWQTRVTNRTI